MTDLLGLTVQEAQAVLASKGDKSSRIIETSGYKAPEDLAQHTDVRIVGVRETGTEILLITARF